MDRDLVNQAQGNALCAGNEEHKLQADDGALARARAGITLYKKDAKGGRVRT
jgi:hypothetical protein